jgi:hypothetical protein
VLEVLPWRLVLDETLRTSAPDTPCSRMAVRGIRPVIFRSTVHATSAPVFEQETVETGTA